MTLMLSACTGMQDRLSQIGEKPRLTKIRNPTTLPDYRPVTMPMPYPTKGRQLPNSLWQAGSRSFFKDQRACRVGDILSVKVALDEKAQLQNNTTLDRSHKEEIKAPYFMGGGKLLKHVLPKGSDPAHLLDIDSKPKHTAQAKIDRYEKITMNVAATVVQ
ncbi:MAG: flagellar basal body L-ring protein FlgH, partial [Holosporales bacterium]|nr:flagellar basal body L-ring protein FlgH [Holosporales bacterium]